MSMKWPLAALFLCVALGPNVRRAQANGPSPAPATSLTPNHKVHHNTQVMGTVVDLTLWTNDDTAAENAAKAVFEEFARVDRLMSSWLPDSDIAKVNNAGARAVVVAPEVMKLVLRAHQAGKLSKGAFDISVGAYRGLWKFDQDIDGSIPSQAEIKKRTKLVNYKKVRLNEKKKSVRLARKGMRITLGGVAKGYAVDQAVAILRKRGLNNFIIQAGGDLFASGQPDNRLWSVGIRDPRGARDAPFAVAQIKDRTFSTSGDYERSLIKDGRRYHHILDPKTGAPANRSRSVTVLANDALTADIWSTALFVMGPKEGMAFVESRPDLDAVFVGADNKPLISSGLAGKVKIQKPPTPGL